MKKMIYCAMIAFMFFYSTNAFCLDSPIDEQIKIIKLKIALNTLYSKDQFIRSEMFFLTRKYSLDYLIKHPSFFYYMQKIDKDNLTELKTIYKEQGWPTLTTYGDAANHQAYVIVLHAVGDIPFQKQILILLAQLAKQHEAKWSQVAYLTDKIAVQLNQLQTYGTQGTCIHDHWTLIPVIDPAHLNERRKTMGLTSFSEYLKKVSPLCKGIVKYPGTL